MDGTELELIVPLYVLLAVEITGPETEDGPKVLWNNEGTL